MTSKIISSGQSLVGKSSKIATRSAYVRAAILGGFEELVTKAHGNARTMAACAGIPERALHDPDMVISWTAVGELMEIAAEELGKPSLGLEWLLSAPEPLLNFGAIALIARFTATIDEWCFHSRNYWHHHTNASRAELLVSDSGEVFTLRVHFSKLVPPSRHQVEYILGGVCALLRSLTATADDGIDRIRFRHVAPEHTALHDAFFPCPVEYGCAHNDLVYHRRLHEHPIELQPEIVKSWFTHYIDARAGTISDYDGSTRANVEIAIPSLIGTVFCTQPRIADLLLTSAKSLQRQLAREKVNFAALHAKGRERMARHLLAESDIPVASIAGLLGYTETSAFTAAVRRWTGKSPRAFRNASNVAAGQDG